MGWPRTDWTPLIRIGVVSTILISVFFPQPAISGTITCSSLLPETTFVVNLECHPPRYTPTRWCAEIFFEEVDEIRNDPVFWARICTKNKYVTIDTGGLRLGGDGFLDCNYEIGYKIYHTCNEGPRTAWNCIPSERPSFTRITAAKNYVATFDVDLNRLSFSQNSKECKIPTAFIWSAGKYDKYFTSDGNYKSKQLPADNKIVTWSPYRTPTYAYEVLESSYG